MPTLYLIDGYAQFFRAYHAIRTPMTSPVTKEPTNMTFGFVGMLLKLLRGQGNLGGKPDYVAVALDVSGDRGTFRSQLYPEYKATRPEPPDDLRVQVERCLSMLERIGVPVVGSEGFEADDVMATLVDRLRESHPDLTIRLVSKDKDLKQLLREAQSETAREREGGKPEGGVVEVFDVHTDSAYTARTLREETGLSPGQVVDMLALSGDTVDNVPGVEGVGEKTAAQLVREFGSLDALLARSAEVKGKRGENLREAAPLLPLSRQLVTLRTDAPVEFDLERARADRIHLERLTPILKELGFNRYQEEVKQLMGGASPEPAPRPAPVMIGGLFDAFAPPAQDHAGRVVEGDYRCVRTRAELDALAAALAAAPAVAFDTETTGLSPIDAKLCGLSFCVEAGRAWYVPVRSPEPSSHLDEAMVLAALRPILEDPGKPKHGHNLKFDMLALRSAGVRLAGLPTPGSCDSMVASYLIDSSRSSHSLDALSMALLGVGKRSITELIGSGREQVTFERVPVERATPYAAADADLSFRLCAAMLPQIRAMGLVDLMVKVELPLVGVLAELEWNGITVDPAELDRQRGRLLGRIEELRARIDRESRDRLARTFDPDSPRQLAAVLFNKPDDDVPGLGLAGGRKIKTGYSTDAEVLEKLAADPEIGTPIPALIIEYRQLTKLVSTYLVALKEAINPRTGRVHARFNQTVAATGRLSSSDPNLQNIPIRTDVGREIRKAFVAPPGRVLVSADYSQIELRLLAHLSRDPALVEAFHRGDDIHAAVAAQIHGVPLDKVTKEQRSGAKMVNFGIVYGVTPFGLARRLGVGNDKAAEIIDGYKKRFAGITTFLEECIAQARRFGYVETMLKRRRPITDIDSNNPSRRALAERVAINSVVQGSAADLIKIAMVDIQGRIDAARGQSDPLADVLMLLQIHDELVFEAPESSAERVRDVVVERMEAAMTLSVPLKADAHVARDWYEGK
ncbi:MAG: DNA polymerase I [Phycisphaerae bacterium]|nr:DNA polymerase I [Phycisphaerae bacterium]